MMWLTVHADEFDSSVFDASNMMDDRKMEEIKKRMDALSSLMDFGIKVRGSLIEEGYIGRTILLYNFL